MQVSAGSASYAHDVTATTQSISARSVIAEPGTVGEGRAATLPLVSG
jgi:hypothetical protein